MAQIFLHDSLTTSFGVTKFKHEILLNGEVYAPLTIDDINTDVRVTLSGVDDVQTDIRAKLGDTFYDINTDIRTVSVNLDDINTDIRIVFPPVYVDVDMDIRAVSETLKDLDTDIRVNFPTSLNDINTDIRTNAISLNDVATDIRAKYNIGLEDIGTDIRVDTIDTKLDISTDIRVSGDTIKDISTDIRINNLDIKDVTCDIRVAAVVDGTDITVSALYFLEGESTNTQDVNIYLSVENAINMRFADDSNPTSFTSFEVYATDKEWTLSAGNGTKTVHVQFQDVAGNISATYSIAIDYNTATPDGVTIECYEDTTLVTQIADSTYQNDNNPFFQWRVPLYTSGYLGFSYSIDAIPTNNVSLLIGTVIQDGIEVTKATPAPEMTLDVSQGYIYISNTISESEATTLLLSDGGVEDRIDLVYLDTVTLTIAVVEGTENVAPVVPTLPSEGMALAEILVPSSTTLIANTIITDVRNLHVALDAYSVGNLASGQHTLNVKAFVANGNISDVSTFNLYISNTNPEMGEILGYQDVSKTFDVFSNIYQTITDTVYLEWSPSPAEPGPMEYYYTTDGTEPTLASSSTSGTNLTLGAFSVGHTTISIKPYDTVSGNWASTKEFIFVYGVTSATGDTLVIGDSTTLTQSLKEVHVQSIRFNFDSARLCKIFQPVEFDDTLPFALDETLTVVHNGNTLFSGNIKRIERTITINGEGVTYHCVGPRGLLTEVFANMDNEDGINSASITFEDEPVTSVVSSVVGMVPAIINSVQSLPSGNNVFDEFNGQSVEQVLSSIYQGTNYGWYMTPSGSLVSVDRDTTNPGEAKFGVYGTTVNSINPQYNVISSNLQFDVSKRYNRAIIEGDYKEVRTSVSASCNVEVAEDSVPDWNTYTLNTDNEVTKVIETFVSYKQRLSIRRVTQPSFRYITLPVGTWIEAWNQCDSNVIRSVTGVNLNDYVNINSLPIRGYFPQGTAGAENTLNFPERAFNHWWKNSNTHKAPYQHSIVERYCATVRADVLVKTSRMMETVSLPGTADAYGAKTLRLINTNFKYIEDPDEPIDDTAAMIQFALDKLRGTNDIKVNGSITLDTVDASWTLDNTVNLINTAQGAWSSLNAKVVGITFNFDQNTTTLELTSQYLV